MIFENFDVPVCLNCPIPIYRQKRVGISQDHCTTHIARYLLFRPTFMLNIRCLAAKTLIVKFGLCSYIDEIFQNKQFYVCVGVGVCVDLLK